MGPSSRVLIGIIIGAFAFALFGGCAEKAEKAKPTRTKPTSRAEQTLVDLADRYAELDSFSERTRITRTVSSPDGDEAATYHTEFSFRRPNHILYQFANQDTNVIACNGQRLIVYSSADGGYVEQEPPESLAAFLRDHHADSIGVDELLLLAGGDPLEALDNVTLAEGESLDNKPMQVITANVKQLAERGSDEPATGTQSLWVGEDDGLLYKTVLEITRGQAMLRIEEVMEAPVADPDLSDGLFEYQPPEGAKNLTQQ
ncbi:MAG: DUF2092 domain-containing protein [Armatimonadota bacterium]|nr:DUF2092 domain-containing protein [Armatimonadota bacterium]